MATATFDTLKYAKALKAAGISEAQAEAHSTALAEAFQSNFKDIASKDDLRNAIDTFRLEIKNGFDTLRHEMKEMEQRNRHEMKEMEQRNRSELVLLRWMVSVGMLGMLAILFRVFLFRTPF